MIGNKDIGLSPKIFLDLITRGSSFYPSAPAKRELMA